MTLILKETLAILLLLMIIFVIIGLTVSFLIAFFGGGPFVPTKMKAVKKVLKAANIKKGDKVVDIGAGDGRFLHLAEKMYGAKATGYEIDPFVYMLARFKQIFLGWKGKIIRSDFRNHSLKNTDILICYMLPSTLKKFQKKFDTELPHGSKVVSYCFHIGSWKPTKTIPTNKRTGIKRIFIYDIKRDKSAKTRTKKNTKSKTK